MVNQRRAGKLVVLLHADVAGSTELVNQDEHLAHERIRDSFRRFGETISQYNGQVHGIWGDALMAEFERSSDALTAAIAFQIDHAEFLSQLKDNIQPALRVGIAMGEVIIADGTVTGAGVILAQRVEQLARPGSVCITAAVHESVPQRLPFEQEDLGERELKGFKEPIHVYRVRLRSGESIPPPEQLHQSESRSKSRRAMVVIAAISLVVMAGAAYWFTAMNSIGTTWSTKFPTDKAGRGWSRSGVKLGRLNLQLRVPTRWDIEVVEEKDLLLQGFETSREQVAWETARALDGTMNPQVLIATDREGIAHFRVFKLYKARTTFSNSDHDWIQGRAIQYILDRYIGVAQYQEKRGKIEKGKLGSGEELTMIPSVLLVNEEKQYVWIAYVVRGISTDGWKEYIVFFFHNGEEKMEISKNLILEITNFATKMY
jgi:class 3 adenylate cyclase